MIPTAFWQNNSTTLPAPTPTYKIFSGTTTSNSTVCSNGGAEVEYSYTSVSAGSGTVIFYSAADGCNEGDYGISLTITACLPSDATALTLVNGLDPISGTSPRTVPTATVTNCNVLPSLLTTVGNTIETLISTL
jgi:hypothetical protein